MIPRLAFAAAVLVLAGCDRFEDPAGGLPPTGAPTVPGASVQSVYVKGTPTLGLGQTAEFRTESVLGAVRYQWSARGTGGIAVTRNAADEAGLGRVVTLGGTTAGPIVVEATAFDAERRVLARGSRAVTVR